MAHVRQPVQKLKSQPTARPTRKVAAGALAAPPLAVIIGWGAGLAGVDLPHEVTLAFAALVGSLGSQIVSYMTRDRA